MPVYENERGTYIFNSKDLCMIEHIPEMLNAGIDSFKIEGRMKTAYMLLQSLEHTGLQLMSLYRMRIFIKREFHFISQRFQNAHTDSIQPDFSSVNRMKIHRYMIQIHILRNIHILALSANRMQKDFII